MRFLDQIRKKAREAQKTIVFPEGEEPRTIRAAAMLAEEKLARPVLLGDPAVIRSLSGELQADLKGVEIIQPEASLKAEDYGEELYRLRQHKGLSREDASRLIRDPMYYGVMMVHLGDADGLVSGACHATRDMLRPALQIIKTQPGIKVVSSAVIVELPVESMGEDGLLIFSDCVVIPCPTAEELASITVSTAGTARKLCDIREPKAALLSFSTKGSASHELVTKVQEAAAKVHELAPDLLADGELQFDAAVIPEVGQAKAPGSPVAGHANILIFPDLQSANIGYKIAQRLTGAPAVAVLQGLNKPCNDLSRGCTVEEIVVTAAITAVQS